MMPNFGPDAERASGGEPVTATDIWASSSRKALPRVVLDLHAEFRGAFSVETIERVVRDSYDKLLARATVTRWLVVGAERMARERLEALAHAETLARETA